MSKINTEITVSYDFTVEEHEDKTMDEIQAIVDEFNRKQSENDVPTSGDTDTQA